MCVQQWYLKVGMSNKQAKFTLLGRRQNRIGVNGELSYGHNAENRQAQNEMYKCLESVNYK